MQLDQSQNSISGTFVNGDEKVTSSVGTFSGEVLRLPFPQYSTILEAKVANGALKGKYGGAAFGSFDIEEPTARARTRAKRARIFPESGG